MEKKKTDRRVKYTRMVIKDSFIALLKCKPISKITIKEICENADINRATFYAHYQDQYHLLTQIENDVICDVRDYLSEDSSIAPDNPGTIRMLTRIFSYIRTNAEICRVLLSDNVDANFQKLLMELVQQQFVPEWAQDKALSTEDAEYIYTFVFIGCVGIIKKWLDSGMSKTDSQMAQLILKLSNRGISEF